MKNISREIFGLLPLDSLRYFISLLKTLRGDAEPLFDVSTIRYRLALLKIFQKCLIWPQAVFFNEWPA